MVISMCNQEVTWWPTIIRIVKVTYKYQVVTHKSWYSDQLSMTQPSELYSLRFVHSQEAVMQTILMLLRSRTLSEVCWNKLTCVAKSSIADPCSEDRPMIQITPKCSFSEKLSLWVTHSSGWHTLYCVCRYLCRMLHDNVFSPGTRIRSLSMFDTLSTWLGFILTVSPTIRLSPGIHNTVQHTVR